MDWKPGGVTRTWRALIQLLSTIPSCGKGQQDAAPVLCCQGVRAAGPDNPAWPAGRRRSSRLSSTCNTWTLLNSSPLPRLCSGCTDLSGGSRADGLAAVAY